MFEIIVFIFFMDIIVGYLRTRLYVELFKTAKQIIYFYFEMESLHFRLLGFVFFIQNLNYISFLQKLIQLKQM